MTSRHAIECTKLLWLPVKDHDDGWVTVKMSGFMALNVRASSIEAVRFSDLPPRPPQVPMAFDLGAD